MLKKLNSVVAAGIFIVAAGATAQAQVTKMGEGESAKYTLKKKYAASATYKLTSITELSNVKDTPEEKTATVEVTYKDGRLSFDVVPGVDGVVEDDSFEADVHGFKGDTIPLKLFSILELPFPHDPVAVDAEWEQEKFKDTEDDKEEVRLAGVDDEDKTATIEVSLVTRGLGISATIVVGTEDGLMKKATITWEDGNKLHVITLEKK